MALSDRLDVGGSNGGAGCTSRSGSRTSQLYFRSPALLLPTSDRGLAAADARGDAIAAPRGSPRSPISAAVAAGGRLSYGNGGSDAEAIVQRRDSWQSERSISLPALSTLRTSPTALVVGYKGQSHSLTPPPPASMAMTPPSTGMTAAAYYGRRPPHLQAVSQSLVDAWVLMRQHSAAAAAASTLAVTGGGLGRPKVSRALSERLVVAKQVQRAIDMAESDRRAAAAAAAADRAPPALSPSRRLAVAPTERGAVGSGARRRELKFRNIFFNFGSVASSSTFEREESESDATNGFGDERSRLHETSVVSGGSSSPTVKKRVRFMDALCWEVPPTPIA